MSLRLNSAYVSIGALIRLAVSIISIPVLVRLLGLERYGAWIVLNSVVAIAGLLEFGLSTALTNYLAADIARKDWASAYQNLSTSLVLLTCLGCVAAVGLWLFSFGNPVLFGGGSNPEEARIALVVLSWLLVARFWQQWAMSVEAALQRYDVQAIGDTAGALAVQVGVMLLALAGSRLGLLATWLLFITSVTLVGHYIALRRLLHSNPVQFHFSKRNALTLCRFGIAQWISSLGSSLFGNADRIIVNFFLGPTAAGLYSAATSVTIKINELSAIPLRVIPPSLSAAKALSQQSRVHQIFIRATRLNNLSVFLIASPILFWSHPIARLLVGQEYATQTATVLQILGLVYGLYSLCAAGFFTAIGIGQPVINAQWGLLAGLFAIVGFVMLTPRWGLIGAAWANAPYILILVINLRVARLIDLNFGTYLRAFVPTVCMIIFWWLLSIGIANYSVPTGIWVVIFILLEIIFVFLISGLTFLQDFASTLLSLVQNFFPYTQAKRK